MLDELANQLDQVVLAVHGAFLERLECCHLLGDIIFLEGHEFKGQELADILAEELVGFELSWVHSFNKIELINFLCSVRGDEKVQDEVLESIVSDRTVGVKLGLCFIFSLVNRIIDSLEGLGGLEALLLVHIVLDHESEVGDLLLLEALLADGSLANLTTQDLCSNIVLTSQNQLHLVKDEIDLFNVLERTIGLNLNLLDDLRGIINLTICLVHLDKFHRGLRVLSFEENLALSGGTKGVQHGEAVLSSGQFVLKRRHAELNHISSRFLGLSSTLAECNEPLTKLGMLTLIEGCLKL